MPALTDAELSSILSQQISLAKTHDRTERATSRDKALDYYFGNMAKYVPQETNRSGVVSRDLADTVARMLPGIMRVFTASGRMAIAEPVTQQDIEFARQATDGLNYVFWQDNEGYSIVYAATWDALLQGNAPVKVWWDETPVYTTSFHSGLTEDQVALLLSPDNEGNEPEVLAQSKRTAIVTGPDGQPVQGPVYDLKIKRIKAPGSFCVDAIPPEEFLIDANAVETSEAAFTAHWQRKTRSDLVAMGYDAQVVGRIPEASFSDTPEQASRSPSLGTYEAADKSMQLVDYYECYIRIDADGDGEAELVRACYGGASNGELLDWEVWEDEHPFDDIRCEPVPHRWLARSVADETTDVQDVKTVLTRQFLNNIYWQNNPQLVVVGSVSNPEALTAPGFGQPIFAKAQTAITPLPVQPLGEVALMGIAHMDEVLQRRTGISASSMSLDAETLQNQSATAANLEHDASYSQIEIVARNMADGWGRVFKKLLRLMIKHQDYSRTVMYDGKPVVIDPRFWNADMHVTINVGLGTGSRDRDLMMMGQILNTQLMLADRLVSAGDLDDAIDLLPKAVETMTRMAEAAGIRNPEDYYPEFTEQKVAQLKQTAAQRASQPDPKVQADMQAQQAQLQLQAQKQQADTQLATQKAQTDATLAAQKQASDQQMAHQKAMNDYSLQQQQLASELALRRDQLNAELVLKKEQMLAELALQRELGHAKVQSDAAVASDVRPGGEPG